MTERRSPLQGVRVIDLAAYIAGAYCSTLLADMGADVIKVESPAGDAFRVLGGSFQAWNRGKRAMILNLASPEGRSILHGLVADADVVVENYRKGAAEKLGAGSNDVEARSRPSPAPSSSVNISYWYTRALRMNSGLSNSASAPGL